MAESDEATTPLCDQDVVVVDGDGWVLDLPVVDCATVDLGDGALALDVIKLRFHVSRDEEHVEVTLLHDGAETTLASRTYHYLLLTLARARLSDRDLPPLDQGWLDRWQLCKMLAVDMNRLNVDVYRARRQLGKLGVHGAAGLIARRPSTGQIRLGTGRIEVLSL
jgi:hypothetical protein